MDEATFTFIIAFINGNSFEVYFKNIRQNKEIEDENKEINPIQNINSLFNANNSSKFNMNNSDLQQKNIFLDTKQNNDSLINKVPNLQQNLIVQDKNFPQILNRNVEININPLLPQINLPFLQNQAFPILDNQQISFQKEKKIEKADKKEKKENEMINSNLIINIPNNNILNPFIKEELNKNNLDSQNLEPSKAVVESLMKQNLKLQNKKEMSKISTEFLFKNKEINLQIQDLNNNFDNQFQVFSETDTQIQIDKFDKEKVEVIKTNLNQIGKENKIETIPVTNPNDSNYSSFVSLFNNDEKINHGKYNDIEFLGKDKNDGIQKINESIPPSSSQSKGNNDIKILNNGLEGKIDENQGSQKIKKNEDEDFKMMPQIHSLPKESSDLSQEMILGNIFKAFSENNPFALNYDKNESMIDPHRDHINYSNVILNPSCNNDDKNKSKNESANQLIPNQSKPSLQTSNQIMYNQPFIPNSESNIKKVSGDKETKTKKKRKVIFNRKTKGKI